MASTNQNVFEQHAHAKAGAEDCTAPDKAQYSPFRHITKGNTGQGERSKDSDAACRYHGGAENLPFYLLNLSAGKFHRADGGKCGDGTDDLKGNTDQRSGQSTDNGGFFRTGHGAADGNDPAHNGDENSENGSGGTFCFSCRKDVQKLFFAAGFRSVGRGGALPPLAPEQLVGGDAEDLSDDRDQAQIRECLVALPAADGLVRHAQLFCQLFLGHAACLTQNGDKAADGFGFHSVTSLLFLSVFYNTGRKNETPETVNLSLCKGKDRLRCGTQAAWCVL